MKSLNLRNGLTPLLTRFFDLVSRPCPPEVSKARNWMLAALLLLSISLGQLPQLPDFRLRKPLAAAHPFKVIGRCHAALAGHMFAGPAGPVCCDARGENCGCADYYCAGSACCAASAAQTFPLTTVTGGGGGGGGGGSCACASTCGAGMARCCDDNSCCCRSCGCIATSLPGYHAADMLRQGKRSSNAAPAEQRVGSRSAGGHSGGGGGLVVSQALSKHIWFDSGNSGAALVVAALAAAGFLGVVGLARSAEKSSRDFVHAEEMVAFE